MLDDLTDLILPLRLRKDATPQITLKSVEIAMPLTMDVMFME